MINQIHSSSQKVEARAHTIEELHDALQTIWEDLGISPDEDSELAEFAKPRNDVLTLERIADYERLIAEAQVLRVRTSQPSTRLSLCSALVSHVPYSERTCG